MAYLRLTLPGVGVHDPLLFFSPGIGMFERRPYFVFGDVVSNVAAGILVGITVAKMVNEGWPMPIAMAAGMLVGEGVALPVAMMASTLFGAFEVMLPVMTTGMVTGMLMGMTASTRVIATNAAVRNGALVGVVVLVVTYVVNSHIRSKGDVWTSLTRQKWDRAARAYDFMNGFGPEQRWEPFKRRMFSLMWGKVLFAAIGTGQDIQFFPHGQDIVGIDISGQMLEMARPRADLYRGTLELRQLGRARARLPLRHLRPGVHVMHVLLGAESGQRAGLVATSPQTWRAAPTCSSILEAAIFPST